MGGFLKWWVYPTNPWGFPTKNHHFGVWNGGTNIYGNTQMVVSIMDGFFSKYSTVEKMLGNHHVHSSILKIFLQCLDLEFQVHVIPNKMTTPFPLPLGHAKPWFKMRNLGDATPARRASCGRCFFFGIEKTKWENLGNPLYNWVGSISSPKIP